jgi:protein-S-isoprenylcysteine O-methyltransferase Ste14
MPFVMAKDADHIIIGCWVAFFVYWFISALKVKVTAEKQSRRSALRHRIPIGLSWFLLAYRGPLPSPLNAPLTPRTDFTQIIGAAVCVAGLLVTLWARRTLAGNWSSDVTFKQGHDLVKAGPYRFVRHPIYTGLLVMCLGTAMDIGHLRAWLALVVMFIGFWIKLTQEETLLLRHFPDAYPAYRKQVKALVPFII